MAVLENYLLEEQMLDGEIDYVDFGGIKMSESYQVEIKCKFGQDLFPCGFNTIYTGLNIRL